MAAVHLMVGAVLLVNEETLLLTDGTLFAATTGMHLPAFPAETVVVIEYEIIEGRNVLTHVPAVRP